MKNNLPLTRGYVILTVLYMFFLLMSNLMLGKLVQIGPFITNGALFLFPCVYIISDIMTECYGMERSLFAIRLNVLSQILFSFIAAITVFAPYPDTWGNQSAYETVLQITPIVSAVSVTAYYFGDWLNSAVLSFMKARMHKAGFGARAIMSTVVGQVLDTLVFYLCLWPFHIWDNMPLTGYLLIGLTDYAVKVGQEVVFLPLTKKVVAFWKRYDGMDEYDTGEIQTYNPFRV